MSSKDDWFRLPCLTEEAKAEFERRLVRSRSSRYEYMRIQASGLVQVSAFDQALTLIDRILNESPDYSLVAWIWEQRADCVRKMGRSEEAIAAYIKSVEAMKTHPGVQGNAHLSLGSLVYELDRSDLYEIALGFITDFWDPDPIFPLHEFRQFGLTALLLNALGESEGARPPARRALAATAKERSNAANHITLGLVGNSHSAMKRELEAIVGGTPFKRSATGGRNTLRGLRSRLLGAFST